MSSPTPSPETGIAAGIEENLFRRLDSLGLAYQTHRHEAAFTVEESRALRGVLPGAHIKNLFLRDKKRRIWLVTVLEDRSVDLKALRHRLEARGNLSFGNADLLMEVLGVVPGAVTPFGIVNDNEGRATVVLDRAIAERGRYPAVNILRSVSRTMPDCNSDEQNAIVNRAKQLVSTFDDMAELIRLGAYRQGSDPQVDEAIHYNPAIEEFMRQSEGEKTELEDCYRWLARALDMGYGETPGAPPSQPGNGVPAPGVAVSGAAGG